MTRVLLIIVAIMAAISLFLYMGNKHLKTELNAANGEISALESRVKGYENEIQKFNEAQERASETIEKVRTVVRTVKSDCDCYHTLVDDRVRDEIRKRRKHRNRK